MIEFITTLFRGGRARVVGDADDHFDPWPGAAADAAAKRDKNALAMLLMRHRHEQHALEQLQQRVNALEDRIRDAIEAGREGEAEQLALALAELESGRLGRAALLKKLTTRIDCLRDELGETADETVDQASPETDAAPRVSSADLLARLRTSLSM